MLEEVAASTLLELRTNSDLSHSDAAHVEVGGIHVPGEVIGDLQLQLRELADSLGFPADLTRNRVSAFDRPATRILYEVMEILPADAASSEVWSFLALVVLPDVAVWRFPSNAEERLIGHPRNVFRRLWWRGETVGIDLIDAEGGLGEDELVNIMERPTVSANARTARGLAKLIFEDGGRAGTARSELMRDVAKRVLRRQAFLCLDALSDDQLTGLMDECLAEAVRCLST